MLGFAGMAARDFLDARDPSRRQKREADAAALAKASEEEKRINDFIAREKRLNDSLVRDGLRNPEAWNEEELDKELLIPLILHRSRKNRQAKFCC